jgi:hypothetical protein
MQPIHGDSQPEYFDFKFIRKNMHQSFKIEVMYFLRLNWEKSGKTKFL